MKMFAISALAATLALAGCSKGVQAPSDAGVCWAMATLKDGSVKFNVIARNVPDMEHCAAQLEAVRIHFTQLGSNQADLTGAYQGNFIFDQPEGIFTGTHFDGARYPFLVRTGDGRLATPGAMPSQ